MSHLLNENISSDRALKNLLEGNKRFISENQSHPNQTPKRRLEITSGQLPFAAILGCSDSRVPPELIFDQGLGDLFIIRIAGNLIDEMVLGSLEYAAVHLTIPLIMVLGHSQCGAVHAATEKTSGEGHICCLTEKIKPLMEKVKKTDDLVNDLAKANTKFIVEQLKVSEPILSKLVHENNLHIIPAFYEMESGAVEILSD
jgi:carbonic anhydrase